MCPFHVLCLHGPQRHRQDTARIPALARTAIGTAGLSDAARRTGGPIGTTGTATATESALPAGIARTAKTTRATHTGQSPDQVGGCDSHPHADINIAPVTPAPANTTLTAACIHTAAIAAGAAVLRLSGRGVTAILAPSPFSETAALASSLAITTRTTNRDDTEAAIAQHHRIPGTRPLLSALTGISRDGQITAIGSAHRRRDRPWLVAREEIGTAH